MPALGEILLERKLITQPELAEALQEQALNGSRLGDILVGHGTIGMYTLYQALADRHSLPYINLLTLPPDEALLLPEFTHEYLRLRFLPWRKDGNMVTLVTSDPDEALQRWAEAHYGKDYRLAITSPFDIRSAVEHRFGAHLETESRTHLFTRTPKLSARHTFHPDQQVVFSLLILTFALSLAFAPILTLLALVTALHVSYAATMLFKAQVFRIGRNHPTASTPAPPAKSEKLPIYTVLVPLYKEKESLPHLIAALKALDYPASKLDIKLVVEADDEETIRAAMALKPARNVDIIRVPPSLPRTKPKALNYALRFARGEYVTVFDADDTPDAGQLKRAVRTFRSSEPKVACLQARLNYYNANHNLLTRWFAIEYGILFDALLPGLQRMKIPIPLGGTSNHLALAQLRSAGEWDPYNVTEDADLGVRLATLGLKTAMLDAETLEEAPQAAGPWMRQRSRWIKGYMQTWLVHMRDPLQLWQQIGTRSFMGFQFFVGLACVSYLTAPLVWSLSALAWLGVHSIRDIIFPTWLQPLAMLNLSLLFIVHWVQSACVLPRLPGYSKNPWKFRLAAALFPFYWVLHSLASYKSLWQLLVKPHFWEKTEHGISRKTAPFPIDIAPLSF